jgi:hypothetical protein
MRPSTTAVLLAGLLSACQLPLQAAAPDAPGADRAAADDGDEPEVDDDRLTDDSLVPEDLQVSLLAYLWLPAVDGKARARKVQGDVGITGLDALKDFELATVLHGEVRSGDNAAWLEGFRLKTEDERSHSGPFKADVELEQGYVEAAFAHSVDEERSLDLYGGLRRWGADVEVDLNGGPSPDQDEAWTDPFVGLRKRFALDEDWNLEVRGDVGGFDIGDASDISYQLMAHVDYRIEPGARWMVGYRLLDVDYDKGKSFRYDVRLQGLMTGISLRF